MTESYPNAPDSATDDGMGPHRFLSTIPMDVQGAAEAFQVFFGYRDVETAEYVINYPPGRASPAFAFDSSAGVWREWTPTTGWAAKDTVLPEMTSIVAVLCEVEAHRNFPGAEPDRIERECRKLRQKYIGATVDRAIRLAAAQTAVKDWDADEDTLGLPDGECLYLTPTNWREPVHHIEQEGTDYLTRRMAATPATPTPLFLDFLDSLTGGDLEMADGLRTWIGATLLPGNPYHKAHILTGDGKTGKSTLLKAVQTAMGDYAASGRASVFVSEKDNHPAELLPFVDRRLVVLPELPQGALRSDLLKTLTGGDSISVRGMRQNPYTAAPAATLMFSANELPSIRLVDNAIRRRLMIWPCDNVPVQVDEYLGKKLASPEHLGGIVGWLIAGLRKCLRIMYAEESMPIPSAVLNATNEYFAEADVIGQWVDLCCTEGGETLSMALYGAFSAWCESRGRRPIGERAFGLWMGRHYDKRRTGQGVAYALSLEIV